MPTLKASKLGIAKIKQARNEKGWSWSLEDDDTILIEASQILEPQKNWCSGSPYANGVSEGTWKRFLAGRQPINANVFKAYCTVLGLNWEDIVDRRSLAPTNTRQDWEEAIDISTFYGRTAELAQLEQWIVEERCRLVALLGMGGIGKTSLSAKLGERLQNQFEYLIWRSLRNAPPIEEILADLIEFLSGDPDITLPATFAGQVSRLLEYLRNHRCLLLLDDVETVLRSGELAGQYREGYQGYGELIRRVGAERHQSCLVLSSREKPSEISSLAGETLPVRELRVRGLPRQDAKKILEAKGISTSKQGWEELIMVYRGNPLALKLMATTIQELFNGSISQFLDQSTLVLGDILPHVFNQQFERLSDLERGIIYWLAIANQPISLSELRDEMRFSESSLSKLLAALESLKRRSLLEKDEGPEGSDAFFTLQPVFMKYVTNELIEQVCKDCLAVIETRSIAKLGLLRSHSLVRDQEQSDSIESQTRLILTRVIDRLSMILNSTKPIEKQLNEVLSMLQKQSPTVIGYAKTNIFNLLKVIENR
ncbi:MAG TPA: NB-ARC domain-containing protein [Coleofasciculaceae cyanobacterium]